MDELLGEVLDLQKVWTAKNTDAMKRRGVIVRDELAAWLHERSAALIAHLGLPATDVGIQGKDGTGLKTEIPWIRVHSRERSPSATQGWYMVYLFSADGGRVYLSLNQGTTVWTGTDFSPRKPAELEARVDWARPLLASRIAARADLLDEIELAATRSHLGEAYETGNVVAIEYRRDSIPGQSVLEADLTFIADMLSVLYAEEQSATYVPGDPAAEVVEALRAAEKTAGRRTKHGGGQGRLLTGPERKAVELRAVAVATAYFEDQGWVVKDVGATESYDLKLSRGEERLHVEVKGTTSPGEQVILTRAEVERQRSLNPDNALVVVHSITLDRTATPPIASGGTLYCRSPWIIEDEDLTVVSYIYAIGLTP